MSFEVFWSLVQKYFDEQSSQNKMNSFMQPYDQVMAFERTFTPVCLGAKFKSRNFSINDQNRSICPQYLNSNYNTMLFT
jgi:hypothetical protein